MHTEPLGEFQRNSILQCNRMRQSLARQKTGSPFYYSSSRQGTPFFYNKHNATMAGTGKVKSDHVVEAACYLFSSSPAMAAARDEFQLCCNSFIKQTFFTCSTATPPTQLLIRIIEFVRGGASRRSRLLSATFA